MNHRVRRPQPVLDEVVFDVPVDLIVADSPVQTREPFDPETSDEDAALVEVVRQGLWTPPVVLRATDPQTVGQATTYQIEDGHRRIAAHRLAERSTVRALITRHDGREADLVTLRANTFKRLPPVQQARAIVRVRERHGLTFKVIAEMAGLTPRYVSELMRMLEAGEGIVEAVAEGRVSVREAARIGREHEVENGPVIERDDSARPAASPGQGPEEQGSEEGLATSAAKGELRPEPARVDRWLTQALATTDWLNADRAIALKGGIQSRRIGRPEQLAALLLVAVDPDLSVDDALDLAPDLVREWVGRDIIRLLETGLRLRFAIAEARTSARERAMIAKCRTLLATTSDADQKRKA